MAPAFSNCSQPCVSTAALMVALIAGAPAAWADEHAANVYMTGADVRIVAPIEGDLFAAAGRVSVDAPVAGDAILGAGSIDVKGRIGDDLRAAGGIVTITGEVIGEVLIAAGSIAFGPGTQIHGRARLAGRDIAVAGRLASGLDVYGRNVLLLGEVNGPLQLTGERIEVMPSARISGEIRYRSPEKILIHPGARVDGRVTREPVSFEFPHRGLEFSGVPLSPLLTFGLFATGILLLLLFPRFTIASLHTIGAAPLKTLGLGTAILFSFPPVILLLVITIIGIPVALALAALYAIALLAGYLVTAFFIGDRLARMARRARDLSTGWRIGSLLAGLVLLWLARETPLPYAGGLVLLLALMAGVGAMVLQAFINYADRP
jgi:cytoskeletal protein CcmA (bactofilin family)